MNLPEPLKRAITILLAGIALAYGVHLWKVNRPLPDENKELYRRIIVAGKQQEAILGLVSDLQSYAKSHPSFRTVLERHPVEKWLSSAP